MKKVLSAGVGLVALAVVSQQAAAADLPVKAVYKAPPVAVFSWTGFYIGVHSGGGWGTKYATTVPQTVGGALLTATPVTTDVSGGLAGGQIGFNYQIGMWVLGVEAQGSWANLTGSSPCSVLANGVVVSTACTGTAKVDSLGTIAARLGITFDRVMLYAKGGGAWAHDKYDTTLTAAGVGLVAPTVFNASETRWGWMTGVGVEYAMTDNWSAKVEYNYMDLGTQRLHFTSTTTALTSDVDIRQRLHVVKVGINYRFGGPVVARY